MSQEVDKFGRDALRCKEEKDFEGEKYNLEIAVKGEIDAPYYYDRLAILYSKEKNYKQAYEVCCKWIDLPNRFDKHHKLPSKRTQKIFERMKKLEKKFPVNKSNKSSKSSYEEPMDEWKPILESFDFLDKDIEAVKTKSGSSKQRDIIWACFNEIAKSILLRISQDQNDINMHEHFNSMRRLLVNEAKFLLEEGKDFIPVLRDVEKWTLYTFKHQGYMRVQIQSRKGSCENCRAADGKKFEIDKAIDELPIPSLNCTHKQTPGKNPFICNKWTPIQ